MKSRALVPIVVGVIAGGLALYLYMAGEKPKPTEAVRIVKAKVNIDRLSRVDVQQQFTIMDWPKGVEVPDGSMKVEKRRVGGTGPEETVFLTMRGEEIPKMAERSFVTDAFKDMPVLVSMLSQPGQSVTPTQLKPGMVAVSVNTEEQSSVSGLVKPGSKVNILATMRITNTRTGETGDICVTALRDVEVFAVGGIIMPKEKKEGEKPVVARTITFQVTQEEAKLLTLIADRGKLTLALVSAKPGDEPDTKRDMPMNLETALEKVGIKREQTKAGDVKDIRLIDAILKMAANAPSAPAVQPTPGTKSPLLVPILNAPPPAPPVQVKVIGPNRAVLDVIEFENYEAKAPTDEHKKGLSPYTPQIPLSGPGAQAPIGTNAPPIAPPDNPQAVPPKLK